MEIDLNTKISVIIKSNPEAIDAIASVNKHFLKLKNPLLRKLLAPRVSIQEAAKIGGCDPTILLEKLLDLGFTIKENADPFSLDQSPAENSVDTIPDDYSKKTIIDIRPWLKDEIDPLPIILKELKSLSPSEFLTVISPFRPTPLQKLLAAKNYTSICKEKRNDLFETSFFQSNHKLDEQAFESQPLAHLTTDFASIKEFFASKTKVIDVSTMEMPLPMVTILNELEYLDSSHALLVKHRKFPQFLIAELEQRGYAYQYHEIEANNSEFIIYKSNEWSQHQ